MRKVINALALLDNLWLSGEISTSEHDDRTLAICVWYKRKMLKKCLDGQRQGTDRS